MTISKQSLWLFIVVPLGVIIGIGSFLLLYHPTIQTPPPDPVPLSIRQRVSFDVYYPMQSKLPSGYTLETRSFTASNQAVVYEVSIGNQQHLVFSVQQKPSTKDIDGFYSKHMPLTISDQTNVGMAQIGVLNHETVASLPTNTNAWLLVTAPLNINQKKFEAALQALTNGY